LSLSIDAAARDLGYQPQSTLADGSAELYRSISAAA
jgi:nucleoside-diphosphate-sugar epimerase